MHLEPSHETGRAFVTRGLEGPVTMLNLLRFREVADYSAHPELAPDTPISGRAAYARYSAHTLPFLKAAGGEVLYSGAGGAPLIGPLDEPWDLVLIVRHCDVETFRGFANDPGYTAGLGHRAAALSDSRLVPLVERTVG